jgi:hypothetical protein
MIGGHSDLAILYSMVPPAEIPGSAHLLILLLAGFPLPLDSVIAEIQP